MNKVELKGFLKGFGIALILSAAIFYTLVLNIRSTYESGIMTTEEIVEQAREQGMIFITEINELDVLTEDYIIKIAKSYGMIFEEEANE